MRKVIEGSWVGQRSQLETAEFQVGPEDFGAIGAACEQLLQANLAQTAYFANDILMHGSVRPETRQRVSNELVGVAIEKLGKPFCVELEYKNSLNGLVAENGETLRSLNERGLSRAIEEQSKDPRLAFMVERRRADIALLDFIENKLPVGSSVVVASACPDANDLQIPIQVLEDAHYQPELDQAMVWIVTKNETGVTFKTINLFHANPEILAQTIATATSRPVAVDSRERTPWSRTVVEGSADQLENTIIETFDQVLTTLRGQETFHGLTSVERGTSAAVSSEDLTSDKQFIKMLQATENILESVAMSITGERSVIPNNYLQKILTIKKANGSFELEGEKRRAVTKLLNNATTIEESMIAYQVVHTAACSGLWATIDQLYHQQGGKQQMEFNGGDSGVAIGGLSNLESSRSSGRVEYGCPGDSAPSSETKSIFDMNQSEIASTIFGRKVIQTNCPKCDTKGVEAVVEHGTITCGTCNACVDVCTGRTLRNARFRKRAAKVAKKAWTLFGSVKKPKKEPTFKLFDFSKVKQSKHTQKIQKRETIKAA